MEEYRELIALRKILEDYLKETIQKIENHTCHNTEKDELQTSSRGVLEMFNRLIRPRYRKEYIVEFKVSAAEWDFICWHIDEFRKLASDNGMKLWRVVKWSGDWIALS